MKRLICSSQIRLIHGQINKFPMKRVIHLSFQNNIHSKKKKKEKNENIILCELEEARQSFLLLRSQADTCSSVQRKDMSNSTGVKFKSVRGQKEEPLSSQELVLTLSSIRNKETQQ